MTQEQQSDTTSAQHQDAYLLSPDAVQEPPTAFFNILKQVGPGLILTASIVGTGELIATTNLGAKAGFSLLWLVLLSCFIKVFIQIELGRFSISAGETTLGSFLKVPVIGNRLCWLWLIMMLLTQFQIGAMIGGIGGVLHKGIPQFAYFIQNAIGYLSKTAVDWFFAGNVTEGMGANLTTLSATAIDYLREERLDGSPGHPEIPWAIFITAFTIYLLVRGRYHVVERYSTILVGLFTLTTVACVAMLPGADSTAIHRREQAVNATTMVGLSASPSQGALLAASAHGAEETNEKPTSSLLLAAFAMIGITGVGASELVSYPYWCLEKRYARYTGPRDESSGWAQRALGWMKVMQTDAWLSMVVYTLATIAFFVLGAAVLFPQTEGRGLSEAGANTMLDELSIMYQPVLGKTGSLWFIIIGGFVVLYSTLFAATAGNSRVTTDFMRVQKLIPFQPEEYRIHWIRAFSRFFPFLGLVLFLFVGKPVLMVTIGGVAQAIMLPILAAIAIYLRLVHTDKRLVKIGIWDVFLWASLLMFTVAAVYGVCSQLGLL